MQRVTTRVMVKFNKILCEGSFKINLRVRNGYCEGLGFGFRVHVSSCEVSSDESPTIRSLERSSATRSVGAACT